MIIEPSGGQMTVAAPPPRSDEQTQDDRFDASAAIDDSSESVRVASLLRAQSNRIVANWVVRIANMPAFRAMPALALNQLEDAIPKVLDAALFAVASSDPTMDPEPLSRALELAGEHGRSRARASFGIGVVLAEYQQLRTEVWLAFWRIVDSESESGNAPRTLQSRLNFTFDSLGVAAAEAWSDIRMSSR